MNTNFDSRERDLETRFQDLKRRSKSIDSSTAKQFKADLGRWQNDSDQLHRDRKSYGLNAATMAKLTNYGDVETKSSRRGISEAEYKGLFEAVQKRQPSFRIETKASFGEGDFTSGSLPPVLMPQLTQQLPYGYRRAGTEARPRNGTDDPHAGIYEDCSTDVILD
jgi:hypothetical protein